MESSLEKKQRVNLLMDCYGDLLTEKQQTYLDYYYHDDYSLSEIAEILNTTPEKIEDAINTISICYQELLVEVIKKIQNKTVQSFPQNDDEATYSLWRDEEDYFIDWNLDSNTIERTINALGFPYTGAKTTMENQTIILSEAKAIEDINIVNRTPGKVIFMEEGNPIIVCGKGLLKINEMKSLDSKVIQLSKFRTRLK